MNTRFGRTTETGGRKASTRAIPPNLALAVGMPSTAPPKGWQWSSLTELARLESGHTPSRRHPEWWGGEIPWIGIQDAKVNNGKRIFDTIETTNAVGIANSSARILPTNTVCLSRTASVGYVVVMGRPMATSQDFLNWVCSDRLDPNFLKYLFIAEGRDLLRFASGAVHQTIYFPEGKAFHICHPSLHEQQRIVAILDEAFEGIATAMANAEMNGRSASALFECQLSALLSRQVDGSTKTTIGRATAGVFTGPFGSLLHKRDYIANGIPLVNPAHITETGIQPDRSKTVSKETANRLDNYILSKGDIVIGRRGEMGRCAVVTEAEAGWLCGTGSFYIRSSERCDPHYLVRLLRSDGYRRRLERLSGGAVMPNLSNIALANLAIELPPIMRQEAIVKEIDSLATQIDGLARLYEQKLVALKALKKSLLHAAFSGNL